MRHRLAYLKGVPLPCKERDHDFTLYEDLQCLLTDLRRLIKEQPGGHVSICYAELELIRFTWWRTQQVRRGGLVDLDQEYWFEISVQHADETSGDDGHIDCYLPFVLSKELSAECEASQ